MHPTSDFLNCSNYFYSIIKITNWLALIFKWLKVTIKTIGFLLLNYQKFKHLKSKDRYYLPKKNYFFGGEPNPRHAQVPRSGMNPTPMPQQWPKPSSDNAGYLTWCALKEFPHPLFFVGNIFEQSYFMRYQKKMKLEMIIYIYSCILCSKIVAWTHYKHIIVCMVTVP